MLEGKLNSELGNESFDKKRKAYGASVDPLTKQIATVENLDVAAIDERQHALAKLAAETWPLSAD